MTVEQSINLLITKAEVKDLIFRKKYNDQGYYLQVEVALYVGSKQLTTLYLNSGNDPTEINYIEFDAEMENALDVVLSKIRTNANLSLQRINRMVEAPEAE